METIPFQKQIWSTLIPAALTAVGIFAGKWVPMRIEHLGQSVLFIITKEYLPPRALFELQIWLPGCNTPLNTMMTAAYVERTWDGYGVGAQCSGISCDGQAIWDEVYRQAASAATPGYCETVRFHHPARRRSAVVLDHAIPISIIDALCAGGLTVETARTAEQALALVQRGGVDLVIGQLSAAGYDGLALCRSLAELRCPPLSVLLSGQGSRADFESGLYAGATQIIARSSTHAILTERIRSVLRRQGPAAFDGVFDDDEYDFAPIDPIARQLSMWGRLAAPFHSALSSARRFFRSSRYQTLSQLSFS